MTKTLSCAWIKIAGFALALAGWMLIAVSAQGETIKGKAGELVILDSKAKGEVRWFIDKRLRDPKNSYVDLAQKRIVIAAPGGEYTIISFEKGSDEFREWTVVIEGVGPGPGPQPDSLTAKLSAAFALDKSMGKGDESDKAKLVKFYGEVLPVVVDLDLFKTVGDITTGRTAVLSLGLRGALPKTQELCEQHVLERVSQPEDADLTPALRKLHVAVYAEIVKALGGDPGPGPAPNPGVRTVLIVRETADSTPELARAITSLRAGQQSKYLKEKGHTLTILDDDAVGPDGKPSPTLEKWKAAYKDLKLPAVVIADSTGRVIRAEALSANATADSIIDTIKKAGG